MRSEKKTKQPLAKGAKKNKIFRNFQGYSMKLCRWRSSVGQRCCKPRSYAKGYSKNWFKNDTFFCRDCLLEPCFVKEKKKEIDDLRGDIYMHHIANSDWDNLQQEEKNTRVKPDWKKAIVNEVFAGIFSKKYVKISGLPKCAREYVDQRLPTKDDQNNTPKEEDPVKLFETSSKITPFTIPKEKAKQAKKFRKSPVQFLLDSHGPDSETEDDEAWWSYPHSRKLAQEEPKARKDFMEKPREEKAEEPEDDEDEGEWEFQWDSPRKEDDEPAALSHRDEESGFEASSRSSKAAQEAPKARKDFMEKPREEKLEEPEDAEDEGEWEFHWDSPGKEDNETAALPHCDEESGREVFSWNSKAAQEAPKARKTVVEKSREEKAEEPEDDEDEGEWEFQWDTPRKEDNETAALSCFDEESGSEVSYRQSMEEFLNKRERYLMLIGE